MVQICNAFVHFYYSWRLYYDMIFVVPIYFFSDFSSKELLNSESEEKEESLEM